MKTVHDRPEVEKEFSLWQKMKARLTGNLRKHDTHQNSGALDGRAERKRNAEAILAGKTVVDNASERRESLGELHRERFVLHDAIELQKRRHADSIDRASREMAEAAGPALEEAAQHLADTLVVASEAADNLTQLYEAHEDGGVVVSTRYPAIYLGNLRASDPASWANVVVDDLIHGYNVSISRDVLGAAEKSREKFHLEEQELKRKHGQLIYAGPQGSGTYEAGKKKKDGGGKMRLLQVPPAIIR